MNREMTDKEMIDRLVDAGWDRQDAEEEVERSLKEAAIEDGYDGPLYDEGN